MANSKEHDAPGVPEAPDEDLEREPNEPAHGIQPMPSPDGVEGNTDFSVIDE